MAPVTQLGLVLLATASLATAQRHKGRGLRHSHKKNAQNTKRGCLYISPEDTKVCDILGAGNSGVSWSTNWDSSPDNGAGNLEYIPQLWGGIASNGFDHTTSWTQNAAAAIKNGATALMGYNEPDNSGQANMDAAAAFAIWNLVTDFKATNDITVISPCVTSTVTSAGYSGLNWLSEFQSAGAAWDATCVHFYEQCSTLTTTYDATPLTEFVQKAASQFGKPVWVTEFGCYDNPATEQMGYFLTGAVTALENESTCAHYAAFNAGLLVDTATSSLNVAGQAYVSIASS
ncbi:hypothetical protein ANO11243_037330 [Dothideomycetidae sp. 11243]|nr:hypothetical protein ANO11243_037330 [fungal sp. No.11243]